MNREPIAHRRAGDQPMAELTFVLGDSKWGDAGMRNKARLCILVASLTLGVAISAGTMTIAGFET